MDVIFYPDGGGAPIRLTGDRPEEGTVGNTRSHERAQEAVSVVRGAGVKTRDYGNSKSVEEFSVERTHPDEAACSRYYDLHAESLPPLGRVDFQHRTSTGALASVTSHAGCTLLCTGGEWDGSWSRMNYRITWGA